MREQRPQCGRLPPGQFVPLTEQTGLIRLPGIWMLDAALRQCQACRQARLAVPVAVNLSMHNISDAQLLETTARMPAARAVPPDWLTAEITERALTADAAPSTTSGI